MSRATRAVAASTKAHSRRCASATAALTSRSAASGPSPVTQRSPCRAGHVHDRPHLDAAERRRAELGDLEGVIEIAGLDQVVAAERLLGLVNGPSVTMSSRMVVAVLVGCSALPPSIWPPFSPTCSANRPCAFPAASQTSGPPSA